MKPAQAESVRIHCDASCDQEARRGSWAAVIVSKHGIIKEAGVIPWFCDDSNHCELVAVANAVHLAVTRLSLVRGDHLIAETDSDHAQALLTGRRQVRKDRVADVSTIERLKQLIRRAGVSLDVVKVPGHSADPSPSGAWNRWCDAQARAALAAERGIDAELLRVAAA